MANMSDGAGVGEGNVCRCMWIEWIFLNCCWRLWFCGTNERTNECGFPGDIKQVLLVTNDVSASKLTRHSLQCRVGGFGRKLKVDYFPGEERFNPRTHLQSVHCYQIHVFGGSYRTCTAHIGGGLTPPPWLSVINFCWNEQQQQQEQLSVMELMIMIFLTRVYVCCSCRLLWGIHRLIMTGW